MRFTDRIDAGQRLAVALLKFAPEQPIVCALPRGGVPLGVEVARALKAPLDLVITRKIGHPAQSEYAICALGESGVLLCNEVERERVDEHWLQQQVAREMAEAHRRRKAYLGDRPALPWAGRTVILVDDGMATGLTMRAAIKEARLRKPRRLVVAVPVAPPETAAILRQEADELVALDIDADYLGAVGAYYDSFPQVSDEEVVGMMKATVP